MTDVPSAGRGSFDPVAAAGVAEVQALVHLIPGDPVGRKTVRADGLGKEGHLPHQDGAEHALGSHQLRGEVQEGDGGEVVQLAIDMDGALR